MAAIVGLGAAGGNFALSQGMRYGPAGLTSAFAKANIIIVILLSSVYYGETITWIEGLGILFFFLAMIVVNLKVNKLNKPTNRTWVLIMMACIILLAFRNGGLKVVNELGLSGVLVAAVAYTYCAMVSIMLILVSFQRILTFLERIVMPRSRSRSLLSLSLIHISEPTRPY